MEKNVTKDAEGLAVRDVQKIIGDYFNDQDPRVRTAAIKAMVNMMMETKWSPFFLFVLFFFHFFFKLMANATLDRYILNPPRIHFIHTFRKVLVALQDSKTHIPFEQWLIL